MKQWSASVRCFTVMCWLGLAALPSAALAGVAANCSTFGWSAKFGTIETATPFDSTPRPRYSDPCAAIADTIGDVVEDQTPSSESALKIRFYVLADFAGPSSVDVFKAKTVSADALSVRTTSSGVVEFSITGSVIGTVQFTPGKWHSVELDWQAGSPGRLGYAVTTPSSGSAVVTTSGQIFGNNGTDRIETVQLGAVSGQLMGKLVFDAYSSSRTTAPGLACRCDANGDGRLSVADRSVITGEISGQRMARGQPDCNLDGVVSVADRAVATNLIAEGAVCPAPGAAILFSSSFSPNCASNPDNDRLSDCVEFASMTFGGPADPGTDPNNPDTDGDSISDGDEVLGATNGLNLPAFGVSPLRKDLLVEYDWFEDGRECAFHSHRPTQEVVNRVRTMFGAAPSANRDGSLGVNVIQDYGQGGAFTGGNLVLGFDSQLPGTFDSTHGAIKQNNFAVQRSGYFHYVLMAHRYAGGSSSSGFAELPGDDSIVTLYCFNSDTNVANTIAHELGHNFGLDHGGSVACNGKPNYNSVMNYRFQFPGVDTNCDTYGDGVLDYSRGTRISLNESNLNEFVGICGSPSLDWNGDGFLQSSVAWDLNPEYVNSCPGPFSALDDHNDWGAVQLNVAAMAAMGASIPSQTVTCPPPPGG